MYQSERFEMRLTAKDLQLLDKLRGPATRSGYLRALLHKAAETVSPNTEEDQ